MLRGQSYGDGEGRSKKQAEQEAARVAWERLQTEHAELAESSGDAPALASSAAREGNDA